MRPREATLGALLRHLEYEVLQQAMAVRDAAARRTTAAERFEAVQAQCEQLLREVMRLQSGGAINVALLMAVKAHYRRDLASLEQARTQLRDLAQVEDRLRDELAQMRHREKHLSEALEAERALARSNRQAHEAAQLDDLWLARQGAPPA
jgi:hypothetical protein